MADTEEPMSETLLYRALGVLLAPSSPAASAVATVVRLAAGAILIGFGQSKFVHHAKEVRSFDRYGLPAPEVFTYAIGTAELVGGILLVVGLMTRLVALGLAGNMVGAVATGGRVDGGFVNLGLAPTLLVAMLFLVWAGAGRFALDDLLARRVGLAEPVDESSRNRHVHVTDT
jgi:putative oxidoreductase